jgi:hypothetical protein
VIRVWFSGEPNGYVDFLSVPVTAEKDFRCDPEGLVTLEEAIAVANDLKRGDVSGYLQGRRWYRRAKP